MTLTIPEMTPGTSPYALTTLLELSIPTGPTTVSGTILDVVQSVTHGGLTEGLNLPFDEAYSGGAIFAPLTASGGSGYTAGSGYTSGTAVLGLSTLTAGSGYVQGYYANVPLTNLTTGTATGVTANIVVGTDGLVKSATVQSNGAQNAGYAANDVLTCANTDLGGSGSGWQILVGTVGAIYTGVPLTGGAGSGAQATLTVNAGQTTISKFIITANGTGYLSSDTLGVSAASVGGTGSGFALPLTAVGGNPSSANSYLWERGTVSGNIAAAGPTGASNAASPNLISLTDDSTAITGVPICGMAVYDSVGAVGGANRVAMFAFCDVEGAPTSANVNYVGMWGFAKGSVSCGAETGYVFGMNAQAAIGVNCTGWKAVAGGECDVTASIGSNPVWKIGWVVTTTGSDAVHGSAIDTGYMLTAINNAQNPTNGFNTGFLFSDNNGAFPVTAAGTMIGTNTALLGSASCAIGIDFSGVTFTTAFLKGPGSFLVDGSANIDAASLVLPGTSTSTISGVANVSLVTFSSPPAPTSGYGVNANSGLNALQFWAGGNDNMQLNNAGTLTLGHSRAGTMGVTISNTNTGSTTQSSLIFGNSTSGSQAAIQLNGGSFSGGAGANALAITNGAGALIQLGGGTEVIEFGTSAAFSANGSVATSLGSLGPTGAHTTVQTWLTFKDSGGTTRYVPCF